MPSKINSVNQNYGSVDIPELSSDMELADLEELGEREFAIARYQKEGTIPAKVAKADASTFGLKKAFWDVYSPANKEQTGQWILEKDAESGDEFIVRKIES